MDIRAFGPRPTRRLTQSTPSRPRKPGPVPSAARGGETAEPGRATSGLMIGQGVQPRSARQGYAVARRMQEE